MRNVPSIPPPVAVPEEAGEVRQIAQARPVKPVSERSISPLVVTHFRPAESEQAMPGESQPSPSRRGEADRRKYCRRLDQKPERLMDTRTGLERRRRNRRGDDIRTNVEEKA